MIESRTQNAGNRSQPMDETDGTAREESHEPDAQKSDEEKLLLEAGTRARGLLNDKRKRADQPLNLAGHKHIRRWLPRFFRSLTGEPYPKRPRHSLELPIQATERFQILAQKSAKKHSIEAALHYNAQGEVRLEIVSPGWEPVLQYVPETLSANAFNEFLKRERLASVCSYHDIKTRKDYFHCIWQVENPAKSEFFCRPPRRSREEMASGLYPADVTVQGPIFDGVQGTSWQAVAYPFGYRSNRREGLVGMAVRYTHGTEPQVSAGFQISLLEPSQMNYRGLQETVKDHCTKLQETSKKSNLFKRGKKGWVLRKFATREQMRKCKKTCLIFVLSFCVYGREQMQFRHRFSKDSLGAEEAISAHMRRLWNNGNPAGRIRMEAKNGKIFRVHSTVLQLNGGVLGFMAANIPVDSPKHALKFPDLTEAVLKKLLEYCYTLQVSAIHKTPFELLLAAHRYNLVGLQDLAEKDVARCIDLDNVLDLYTWNESLHSEFLSNFISLFFAVNYAQVRQLPEFEEKLSVDQQGFLDDKYRPTGLQGTGEQSEGGEGYLSEDNPEDGDSGLENDEDGYDETGYDDGQEDGAGLGQRLFLSMHGDHSAGQEEAILGEFGEEPEEFQLQMMNVAHVNVIVNQAELDQAAAIAQMFGDIGGLEPDALEFLMMLM